MSRQQFASAVGALHGCQHAACSVCTQTCQVLVHVPIHHHRLRFSLAFWHTMRADGSDPFGAATKNWPWEQSPPGGPI